MALFKVIAQNFDLLEQEEIAQTNRVTCDHLFRAKASGTLLGHPDLNEHPQIISAKVKRIIKLQEKHPDALPYNVILIGEDFQEFSNNSLFEIAQLMKDRCAEIFKDIPDNFIRQALLIYEPKWLSKPNETTSLLPPSPKLISRVTNKMRDFLIERLGPSGHNVSLMYGEITSPERAVEILADENLQGLMLGSSCFTTSHVLEIAKALQYTYEKRKIILVCNFKSHILSESFSDYLSALAVFPDNFMFYFAPATTEIRTLAEMIKR